MEACGGGSLCWEFAVLESRGGRDLYDLMCSVVCRSLFAVRQMLLTVEQLQELSAMGLPCLCQDLTCRLELDLCV